MRDKLINIISEIMEEDFGDSDIKVIKPDLIENWDSLNHMLLIIALEKEFKKDFSIDEVSEMLDGAEKILEILNKKNL